MADLAKIEYYGSQSEGAIPMSHPKSFNRNINLALIILFVVACGAPTTFTATPIPTPTLAPPPKADPALYSEAKSLCEKTLDANNGNFAQEIPVRTLRPKNILTVVINPDSQSESDGEVLYPYLEATNAREVGYILCIMEKGHLVQYTDGSYEWEGTWDAMLVNSTSHEVVAQKYFSFSPPSVLPGGYGPRLSEQCYWWLMAGIEDPTVTTYPGYLIYISPDFEKMVLWMEDTQNLEIWDITTGEKLEVLAEGSNPFVLSPDWKTFAIQGDDAASVRVFNAETMQEIYTLSAAGLLGFDFSVDGKTLATATYTDESQFSATFWDVDSGQPLKTAHFKVRSGFFSPGPVPTTMLFSNIKNPMIIRQDQRGMVVQVDNDEFRMVGNLLASDAEAFSPDGKILVLFNTSAGFSRELVSGKDEKIYDHNGPVTALTFSPDGKTLAVGDDYGQVILLNTLDWQVKAIMEKVHFGRIIKLAFSSDGTELVSVSQSTIKFWDLTSGE